MKKTIQKAMPIFLAGSILLTLAGCRSAGKTSALYENTPDTHTLELCDDTARLDGKTIGEYDYTWHCDPGTAHDEVKNAPAEYFTGTAPKTDDAAYIDHELYYFPQLPESGFQLVNYDGEQEWAYYYTDGEHEDYIFATLPNLNGLPSQMMHSEEEAAENAVLHITKPGTYVLSGSWQGQIRVELGDKDEVFADEMAKITLVLNGAEIHCSVAPGVLIANAYESDNGWEEREAQATVENTENAGAVIVLADGTENTVTGTNVYRMLKTQYKDEDAEDTVKTQKKMRKTDAAFYSCVTMRIEGGEEGTGKLTVNSGFEGLDSELHLALCGGNVEINSQDDGINVNEDNVSGAFFLGGTVTIHAAQGAEGDGVDSNGFIVVDGGTVSVDNIRVPDSALDSEDGIFYQSGTVLVDGEEQSLTAGSTVREIGGGPGVFGGPDGGIPWGEADAEFDMKTFKEQVAALDDDAGLEDVLALLGRGGGPGGMEMPGGQQPPELPTGQMPGAPEDGQQPPEKR